MTDPITDDTVVCGGSCEEPDGLITVGDLRDPFRSILLNHAKLVSENDKLRSDNERVTEILTDLLLDLDCYCECGDLPNSVEECSSCKAIRLLNSMGVSI